MTKVQITLLAVLAVLAFGIVIGGGYYVLSDSGFIGGPEDEPVARSPVTPTITSEGVSPPKSTTTSESGGKLPPVWTATPFGLAEIDYVQWAIQLSDLPMGFEKAPFEDFDTGFGIIGEDGEGQMVNAFAFAKGVEDAQDVQDVQLVFVFGFTGLVPEHEQSKFDTQISRSDMLASEFISAIEHNGILEEDEIVDLGDLGDIAFGYRYLLDMEGVEMRFDIILFRRSIAGAMIFMGYVDGYPAAVTIQDLAYVLDQRILPTLSVNP